MKLLALDQATLTGWAVLDECGSVTESGVWKLADPRRTGESRGMRYVRFRSFLRQTLDKYQDIRLIVHEQTLLRGGAATEIANGLKALILEAAAEREMDVTCVHTSELKRFATGNGRAEKRDMMETCLSRFGIMPLDDNHADAILIGFWGLSAVLGIRIPENELHAK